MKRYYIIDFSRGIAALAVLLSHYSHFFQYKQSGYPENWVNTNLPLYDYLGFFYHQGGKAVELFFCISGFIFFMFYFKRVSNRSISPYKFFILRFSRLYPLHILTLICVAILGLVFFNLSDFYFIYPENDLKHFILNTFLISHWGLQDGNSFNGPIWSVSIEIFLYGIFFLFSYFLRNVITICLLLIVFGVIVFQFYYSFGIAIVCFFLGGMIYYLHNKILNIGGEKKAFYLTGAAIFALSYFLYSNPISISQPNLDLLSFLVLFPLLLLFFSMGDNLNFKIFEKTKLVGDLSYSIYLIHFPLQLLIVTVCLFLKLEVDFTNPISLLSYIVLSVLFSYISYKFFEFPAQERLRKSLIK